MEDSKYHYPCIFNMVVYTVYTVIFEGRRFCYFAVSLLSTKLKRKNV